MYFQGKKIILVLWLMMTTAIASADLSLTAKVGFDGKFREERITPILIEVDNPSLESVKGKLVLSSEIPTLSGEEKRITSPYVLQIRIPAKTKSTYWLYLPFIPYRTPEINLLVDNKIAASTSLSISHLDWNQQMVLDISQRKFGTYYGILKIKDKEIIFVYLAPFALPDEWLGYDSVEAVLVDNTSLKLLTSKQKKALKIWVGEGGKLLNIEGMSKDEIQEWLKKELTSPGTIRRIIEIAMPYSYQTLVSKIPQMRVPSPGVIFLLLLLYILIIGPINYLILKRKKKSEISWITISIIVIIFSLAFYLCVQQIKGKSVILNEFSLLHIPAGKNWGILNTYFGLFSPQKTNYNLKFKTKSFISFPPNTHYSYKEVGYKIVQTNNETYLQDWLVEEWSMKTFMTYSIVYLDGKIICQRDNHQLSLENTSNYLLLNSGVLINGVYLSLGDIKSQTRQSWQIDKLKEETEYQAKELLTKITSGKENFLFGWLEKPLIELALSPKEDERKSTTLVIIPITTKE